jgi:predicted N-acetyltransferase YhbS
VTTNAPIIRVETSADYPAIRMVVAAAFGQSAEADLVELIRQSSGYIPELALVAEIQGNVVGHVMVSAASLRHESGERSIAMLAPLAVDPAFQLRGVGGALVEAVVALADQVGEAFVVLRRIAGLLRPTRIRTRVAVWHEVAIARLGPTRSRTGAPTHRLRSS